LLLQSWIRTWFALQPMILTAYKTCQPSDSLDRTRSLHWSCLIAGRGIRTLTAAAIDTGEDDSPDVRLGHSFDRVHRGAAFVGSSASGAVLTLGASANECPYK
jgi:hypothetical protein